MGPYVVESLQEAGASVTVVDNLESGLRENIEPLLADIEWIERDLKRIETCRSAAKGQDDVLHLAGRTHGVGYSDEHHGEMLYHNTVSQLNMLEAAREAGVEQYLAVSSSCVYPDDVERPTPEVPTMQGAPEEDNQGYGWAKRVGELQAQYYHSEYDIDVAVARPFNIYGDYYQWRGPQNSHVIPALVKRVMDGEDPLTVWGSGDQRRNFLHARDAANLMLLVTEHASDPEPVNIGFEETTTIAELVDIIADVSGKAPAIEFDPSKPEGAFEKSADSTRLRAVTGGYEPQVDLETGIADMIEWYERTF
jgi:nucleoside-diphosphate-sugar epimerase